MKMFVCKGKLYSISDKNPLGEFVVVKMSLDHEEIFGAKIIPAKSEAQVEVYVRAYPWDKFRDLPNNPVLN